MTTILQLSFDDLFQVFDYLGARDLHAVSQLGDTFDEAAHAVARRR